MAFYEKHHKSNAEAPFTLGKTTCTQGEAFPLHWHENVEILCFLRGEMQLQIDGQTFPAVQGETYIVNSGQLHSGIAGEGGCVYYCLILDQTAAEWMSIPTTRILFASPVCAGWIAKELRQVDKEQTSPHGPYAKTALRLRVFSLFTRIAQEFSEETDPRGMLARQKRSRLGQQIVSYVDEHFREELTTESVCAALGFSKSYVCHTFRATANMTVTEYLQYRRCSYAERLLTSGKYNVSEAAAECGFSNLSYFTRVYRRCQGHLPSEDARRAAKPDREN